MLLSARLENYGPRALTEINITSYRETSRRSFFFSLFYALHQSPIFRGKTVHLRT